jgi:hypothetical protein
MMAAMAKIPDDSETTLLIEQAVRGDQRALSKLLGRHRERPVGHHPGDVR